jgi:hypothetical protein
MTCGNTSIHDILSIFNIISLTRYFTFDLGFNLFHNFNVRLCFSIPFMMKGWRVRHFNISFPHEISERRIKKLTSPIDTDFQRVSNTSEYSSELFHHRTSGIWGELWKWNLLTFMNRLVFVTILSMDENAICSDCTIPEFPSCPNRYC